MLKRIISAVAVWVGLTCAAAAEPHFTIGGAVVAAPAGWREVKKEDERITLHSPDDRQQATISVMYFGADASFEDFKRLCALRIEAEKKELGSGFIEPTAPYEKGGRFGMMFYGGEKKTGRIFAGHLSLEKKALITIYLEGSGVDPKQHMELFETFVTGLKRK